jgi:hypothetical protein
MSHHTKAQGLSFSPDYAIGCVWERRRGNKPTQDGSNPYIEEEKEGRGHVAEIPTSLIPCSYRWAV